MLKILEKRLHKHDTGVVNNEVNDSMTHGIVKDKFNVEADGSGSNEI